MTETQDKQIRVKRDESGQVQKLEVYDPVIFAWVEVCLITTPWAMQWVQSQ